MNGDALFLLALCAVCFVGMLIEHATHIRTLRETSEFWFRKYRDCDTRIFSEHMKPQLVQALRNWAAESCDCDEHDLTDAETALIDAGEAAGILDTTDETEQP